ncbi:hypothetical protein V6N12_009394 [Hibiscus sabdariffa]|uniref:Uncharacterized protein n=1 Tax=Hibiscus sabdariffa TaxID=183260 RepID=A0ABR2E902_9ROSI
MLALYVLKLVLAVWLEDLVPMRPEMVILSQDLAASRLHPVYHLHQGDFLGEVRHMIKADVINICLFETAGGRHRVDRNFVSDNVVVSTPHRAYEAPTPGSGWASTLGSSYSEAGTPRDSGSQT